MRDTTGLLLWGLGGRIYRNASTRVLPPPPRLIDLLVGAQDGQLCGGSHAAKHAADLSARQSLPLGWLKRAAGLCSEVSAQVGRHAWTCTPSELASGAAGLSCPQDPTDLLRWGPTPSPAGPAGQPERNAHPMPALPLAAISPAHLPGGCPHTHTVLAWLTHWSSHTNP